MREVLNGQPPQAQEIPIARDTFSNEDVFEIQQIGSNGSRDSAASGGNKRMIMLS